MIMPEGRGIVPYYVDRRSEENPTVEKTSVKPKVDRTAWCPWLPGIQPEHIVIPKEGTSRVVHHNVRQALQAGH